MSSLEDWKQRKEEYSLYLKSPKWKSKRLEIFKERNGHCERCKINVGKIGYQVHHKTYKNIFNELNSDLELLCKLCHEKEHGINKKPKQKKEKTNKNKYITTVNKNHNKLISRLRQKQVNGIITMLEYNIKVKQANDRIKAKTLHYYKLNKI